jgi:hypothetical protein
MPEAPSGKAAGGLRAVCALKAGEPRPSTEDSARSGGVQRGHREGGEARRAPVQQRFDTTRGRERQEQPILVLVARGRDFAQREDDGAGLSRGASRGGPRGRPERLVEDRGPTRPEEPPGVGEKGRRGGAGAVAGALDRLPIVCPIPTGAVEVCIHLGGRRRLSRGHHTARSVSGRHDCRLDDHPPRLAPRRGGVGALLIETAAAGPGREPPAGPGLPGGGPRHAPPARRQHRSGAAGR